jgi:hypothetical protein
MYLSHQVGFTQEGGCGLSNLSSFAHGGEHERQLVSMLPFRARLRTYPQRDVGWLHRLPYHPHQIVA